MMNSKLNSTPVILSATYHQGSTCYPTETRNKQCMTNSLVFLAYTMVKPLQQWISKDLNDILDLGNVMYKYVQSQNIPHAYILPTELPNYFSLGNKHFSSFSGSNYTGLLLGEADEAMLSRTLEDALNLIFIPSACNYAVMICNSNAIGIYKDQIHFVTFDPHKRNYQGLTDPTASGTAVLCRFSRVDELCVFLRSLAKSQGSNNLKETQFDLHSLNIRSSLGISKWYKNQTKRLTLPYLVLGDNSNESCTLALQADSSAVTCRYAISVITATTNFEPSLGKESSVDKNSCCCMFFVHSQKIPIGKWTNSDINLICQGFNSISNFLQNSSVKATIIPGVPKFISYNKLLLSITFIKSYKGPFEKNVKATKGLYTLEKALPYVLSKNPFVICQVEEYTFALFKDEGVVYMFKPYPTGHYNSNNYPTLATFSTWALLCASLRIFLNEKQCAGVSFTLHHMKVMSVTQAYWKKKAVDCACHILTTEHSDVHTKFVSPPVIVDLPFLNDVPSSQKRKTPPPQQEICHTVLLGMTDTFENIENSTNTNSILHVHNDDVPPLKKRKNQKSTILSVEKVIEKFHTECQEGPTYVCTCCTQTWFKSSTIVVTDNFRKVLKAEVQQCLTGYTSMYGKEWLCRTCEVSLKRGQIPCCYIQNGIAFPPRPNVLTDLTPLEERLISPRIPFMQIREQPRGKQLSIHGNVVNVPADVNTTVRLLPRTLDDSETIPIKFKRKKSYKQDAFYEVIRPNHCLEATKWLLENSVLFKNEGITLQENWLAASDANWSEFVASSNVVENPQTPCETTDEHCPPSELGLQTSNTRDIVPNSVDMNTEETQLCCPITVTPTSTTGDEDGLLITNRSDIVPEIVHMEINESPDIVDMDTNTISEEQRFSSDDNWTEVPGTDDRPGQMDTVMHPMDFRELDKILIVSPGEGNTPLSMFQDSNSEFLAFPTIYCGQTRPDNNSRLVPLHYSTICKWELRNVDRRVALCVANMFYKMKKLQIKQINDYVSMSLRKCQKTDGQKITAGDLLNLATVENLVKFDNGYRVLRKLRGSPPYWEDAKKDIFAMIRQLGIPTFFCSFSAAETRWADLLIILAQMVDNKVYTENEVLELTWQEKCRLIKSDPVTCARYFDNRFLKFMNLVLDSSVQPIGEISDSFRRVEFQQRGSPHIHMLIWIKNAPIYKQASSQEITTFVDKYITCCKTGAPDDLINYQSHRHAKSCKKNSMNVCRFNFPRPPMKETTILTPLETEECTSEISDNLEKIRTCLAGMKSGEDISCEEFLKRLELSEESYILAVRSSLKHDELLLQRTPAEIRINNYNSTLLKSWKANLDIQFVLDPYACASYIVSYISKGQRGMSRLLEQACTESRAGNADIKQQVRKIGNQFLTHVEISAQEAAYLVLQLPLRRSSRSTVFINTGPVEDRAFLVKSKSALEELPKDSTDIAADNLLKRYGRRPKELQKLCLADFASWYDYICPNKKEKTLNQKTPDGLLAEEEYRENQEDEMEPQLEMDESCSPNEMGTIALKNGAKLHLRKVQNIIRFVRYSRIHDAEKYYREQLMLYIPWRKEDVDILDGYSSYEERYMALSETVVTKSMTYESNSQVIDEVIEREKQGREDTDIEEGMLIENQHLEEQDQAEGSTHSALLECFNPPPKMPTYDIGMDIGVTRKQIDHEEIPVDDMSHIDYMDLVRNLNEKQKFFFYHVIHWLKTKKEPLYNFLSGGAGVGKTVVTTALFQALNRYFNSLHGANPDELKIILCAPTGRAAFNINGRTIHSVFAIPGSQGFDYKPLDMMQLDTLRVKYAKLKLVLIDEISMMGVGMFHFINRRLQDIMGCNDIFGGVSILAIGDLFQLQPVMDDWLFLDPKKGYAALAPNLWEKLFTMYELTDIMRQKDDAIFAKMLNRLREGNHTKRDLNLFKTRILDSNISPYPYDIPHLYTTNAERIAFNNEILDQTPFESRATVQAIDSVTGDFTQDVKKKILGKIDIHQAKKTGGLITTLEVAPNLPVEICRNVDVLDGITNGTPGILKKCDYRVPNSNRVSILWVLFDEPKIGRNCRHQFSHLYQTDIDPSWTPILEQTRQFTIHCQGTCRISRRQFPLQIAAARTIHKAQGATMNSAVLHFGYRKNEHMHYVGLSRVRNLKGIHIKHFCEEKISVDPHVQEEMERLRHINVWKPCLPDMQCMPGVKFALHNTRSLRLHIQDLKQEPQMKNLHFLAVLESRLVEGDADKDYELPKFHMCRYDYPESSSSIHRTHYGIVIYTKKRLSKSWSTLLSNIHVAVAYISVSDISLQLVVMYCPPAYATIRNYSTFFRELSTSVDLKLPTLIMGDFNIDILQQKNIITLADTYGLRQLINEVTTDYGSALDHIYTNLPHAMINQFGTLESYYSDHKPVYVSINI